MKQIGTLLVLDAMYKQAKSVCDGGGHAFVAAPDVTIIDEFRSEFCSNCTGTGNLALQLIVAGPYRTPLPPVQPDHNNPHRVPMTSMWYNDAWYGVKTYCFKCPVCNEILEL